jgi:hypothetical protein
MDLAERIAWILTGIAVVGVILCAVVGPVKSEISDETVKFESRRLNAHLFEEGAGDRFVPMIQLLPPAEQAQARQARGLSAAEASRPPRPPASGGGGEPAPGGGGLAPIEPGGAREPYEPGTIVPYIAKPVYIPEEAREKYRHFEDVYDLSMTAEGYPTPDGQAWQIGEIGDGSPLREVLGFQRGDIIISVNERPARADNARQLFEELKNERSFRVLIDRGGTRIEIPYTVK